MDHATEHQRTHMDSCGHCLRQLPPLAQAAATLSDEDCIWLHVCMRCRQRYCPGELIVPPRRCNVYVGFTVRACACCSPQFKTSADNWLRDLRAADRMRLREKSDMHA